MEKTFIRVRSAKDITISALCIISGSILAALPTGTSINIAGFFLIFAGIILILALRTGYKETESGIQYVKVERFFAQSMRDEISRAISGKPENVNLTEEDKGNGVRLDIYHSKASGKAFVQLFEYIPYKYEPCSNIYEYDLAQVTKLISK